VTEARPPSPAARALELAGQVLAALAVLFAIYQLLVLGVTLGLRLGYPHDLEWMESGMMTHAQRLAAGHDLYGPPTVDFVPYLYTPGYPALVALLSKPFGLTYLLARSVSVASIAWVCYLAYRICRKEGSRIGGLVAVGMIAASFPFTGAWYDIARADSLFLAMVVSVLYLVRFHARSRWACLGAGVLIVAAFYTKQTASLFGVAAGLALLAQTFWGAAIYGVTAGVLWGGSVWLYNQATGGWFWRWIYQMHQKHDFNDVRAYDMAPDHFWKHMPIGISLVLVLVILGTLYWLWRGVLWVARQPAVGAAAPRLAAPTVGLVLWTFFALVGFVVSSIGFGTQFSWFNAYMPGTTLGAIAIGVAIAELGRHGAALAGPARADDPERAGWRRAGRALAIAAGAVLMARELHALSWRPDGKIPERRDRRAGALVMRLVREAPGDVLVFSHPFYAYQAGKRTFLHRMGIRDVLASNLGYPKGLEDGIRQRRWAMILVDDKIDWDQLPGLRGSYRLARDLGGPEVMRTFSGAETRPKKIYVPIDSKWTPPAEPE